MFCIGVGGGGDSWPWNPATLKTFLERLPGTFFLVRPQSEGGDLGTLLLRRLPGGAAALVCVRVSNLTVFASPERLYCLQWG